MKHKLTVKTGRCFYSEVKGKMIWRLGFGGIGSRDSCQETQSGPWTPYHPVYLKDSLQKKEEGILINPDLF